MELQHSVANSSSYIRIVFALAVAGCVCGLGRPLRGDEPTTSDLPTRAPSIDQLASDEIPKRVEYWVEQLGSDQYLRRERATQWLREAGPVAVPTLVDQLAKPDLETTQRVINLLSEITLGENPTDDGGAWQALEQIASTGVGSQASRATAALSEVREHRRNVARTALAESGVFVGKAEFVIQAKSSGVTIVEIGEDWNGDVDALRWLRWVDDVAVARLVGPAINADVLAKLAEMPLLTTIALVGGEVDDEVFAVLERFERIDVIEFRYIPLDTDAAPKLAALPIRSSLSLMGTGMPISAVDEIRRIRPRLQIEFRLGGFLGVTCQDTNNLCQILSVMPGSAADDAGLRSQDIIIGIENVEVTRFKDLQNEINRHLPDESVSIRFSRNGVIKETSARLGRFQDRPVSEARPIP